MIQRRRREGDIKSRIQRTKRRKERNTFKGREK